MTLLTHTSRKPVAKKRVAAKRPRRRLTWADALVNDARVDDRETSREAPILKRLRAKQHKA